MPNSLAAQEKLRRAGINRPVDDSGHPDWNDAEKAELDAIKEQLDRDYGREDSPGKDTAARSGLEKLLRQERLRLMGLQRITEGADTSSSSNG